MSLETKNVQPLYFGVRSLVLGATGFIGQRVVAALAAAGSSVLATGRDAGALEVLRARYGVEVTLCDLSRADEVVELVRAARPSVTFNLAGYGVDRTERSDDIADRLNAALPVQLAELLGTARDRSWSGQALVHAGSALEYGEAGGDLREDTVALPSTLYGRTKLEATHGIQEESLRVDLPAVTARLFTVYGPGEHAGRLLPALLETARSGSPLDLTSGAQRRDFTFVDDVVDGLLRLGVARAEPGEIVNLATGRLETVRAFAERAARVLGIDEALLRFGATPTRSDEMSHEPVAIDRLRALTGWVPETAIEDGVLQTLHEMMRIDARI